MVEFYRRALKKLDKLGTEQRRELLVSAVDEINLLENVLDSIDVGIIVCDENNNLVMVNKYAKKLLPFEYTTGMPFLTIIEDDKIVEYFMEILLNKERITGKEIEVEYTGHKSLLSFNLLPFVRDRKITGSLIYIEDITERRKGEARLRIAESLASLTTLAAGVAHEIKNPLGSISIHLQLLQKSLAKMNYNNSKTDKYFNVIKEEVDRLNRIVVDFLFAVRPVKIELREGDINKLISQMMEFVTVEMEQSKIVCFLELDENIPKIMMDERLLKQALLNLVKNAQASMPQGGVLTIATNFADNEIRISICDTGTGISRENLAKIFEPYFTTKESGTGLGLTLVYRIVREHQGEITVDSAPDTGTEFKIILPVPQKETRMIAYNETVSAGTEGAGK